MGALLIDSGTKGFTELAALALTNAKSLEVEHLDEAASPMSKLLDLLRSNGNDAGAPTEIMILVNGKETKAFTFVVKDLSEITEVLQWTVGRE